MANDQGLVLRFGVDVDAAQKQLADLSSSVKDRMEAISNSATKSSDEVTKRFDNMATTGQKLQRVMNEGLSFQKVTSQIDGMIARTKEAQGQLQTLQTRFVDLQGKFASGQTQGIGDLGGMLMQAGSLRGAIGLAGGPIGAAALAGGVAYGQIKQFAEIGDLADKANASARSVQGLQAVMKTLGVEAASANGMLGTFSDKLRDARQFGGDFKNTLDGLGISMSNSDGTARSAIAVLADFAAKIKGTTDDSEKMRLATLAVGDQLAGPFLTAINQSKTGLADLAAASQLAGSSLTNDLAAGAQKGMKALSELGARADETYAQLKRLVGLANDADKLKAAIGDLRNTKDAGDNLALAAKGGTRQVDDFGRPVSGVTQDELDRNAIEGVRGTFKVQDIDGTAERAAALQKALANSYGPKPGPVAPSSDDDDDEDTGGGRSRGGGSSAAKQEDDRAQRVLQRLQERLAATKAVTDETGTLAEKQRIVNELVNAGVTAESETGQQIASLVRQIDEQVEAQRRLQSIMSEMRTAANSVESALDGWIVQGRKFNDVLSGLLKQLESQALRSVFNQLFDSGSGKSGAGGGGILSGLVSFMGGLFSSKAEGGFVGSSGPMAYAPFSAFAKAKHYADGGGIPIIAHPGEIIMNQAQQTNLTNAMRAMAMPKVIAMPPAPAGAGVPSVHITNQTSAPIGEAQAQQRPDGGIDIKLVESMVASALRGPKAQSTMRDTYGVRPMVRGA